MIYVLHEAESGYYKVGKARNRSQALHRRLPSIAKTRSLRLGRSSTLSLKLWIPWPSDAEMLIHRYCWRLWRGDEWFEDGPELRQVFGWAPDGVGFDQLAKAVARAGQALPRRWTWHTRDKILAAHAAKLAV